MFHTWASMALTKLKESTNHQYLSLFTVKVVLIYNQYIIRGSLRSVQTAVKCGEWPRSFCTLVTVTKLGPSMKITPFAPLSSNSSLQKSRISSIPFRLKCHSLHLLVNIPIVHSQVTQSRNSYHSHQMRYPNCFSPLPPNPTSLIKSCSSVFSELISTLVNLSFSRGHLPI